MEVAQFRKTRTTQLSDFQKEYSTLKTEYSRFMLAAIQEQDPVKQQTLVQKVLSINADLSEKVRSMIGDMNQKDNKETIDTLTKELIQYQKEYTELQKNKDTLDSLKLIYANDSIKLKQAESMFYFYIFSIIAMCLLIVILIFRTGLFQISVPSYFTGTTVSP